VSSELLQAIGRLTLLHAQLDEGLTFIAADLLHCENLEVAEEMFRNMDVSRKCERLKWLFNHYHQREPWWTDELHQELIDWLVRCNKLIEHPNDIVHGALESDETTNQHFFVRKGRRHSADAAEVRQLNQQTIEELATIFDIMYTINRRFSGEIATPPGELEHDAQTE
jgi:hypothetical protein